MTESTRQQHVEAAHAPYGHGHSIAAWTGVSLVMIGALIMSFAVVFAVVWLFVVGAVVAAIGGPVGALLSAMGLGSGGRSTR